MTLDLQPQAVHRDSDMMIPSMRNDGSILRGDHHRQARGTGTTFENDGERLRRREEGDRGDGGILDRDISRDLLRRVEARRRLMIEEGIIGADTMDRRDEAITGTEKGIGEGNEISREEGLTVVTTPTLEDRGDRCHRDVDTMDIRHRQDLTRGTPIHHHGTLMKDNQTGRQVGQARMGSCRRINARRVFRRGTLQTGTGRVMLKRYVRHWKHNKCIG